MQDFVKSAELEKEVIRAFAMEKFANEFGPHEKPNLYKFGERKKKNKRRKRKKR